MKIAYDAKLKRPGCVLLQASFGCVEPNLADLFPIDSWLLAPTPDLRVYSLKEDQLSKLVKLANLMDEVGDFKKEKS